MTRGRGQSLVQVLWIAFFVLLIAGGGWWSARSWRTERRAPDRELQMPPVIFMTVIPANDGTSEIPTAVSTSSPSPLPTPTLFTTPDSS